jgi:hypothetical protein
MRTLLEAWPDSAPNGSVPADEVIMMGETRTLRELHVRHEGSKVLFRQSQLLQERKPAFELGENSARSRSKRANSSGLEGGIWGIDSARPVLRTSGIHMPSSSANDKASITQSLVQFLGATRTVTGSLHRARGPRGSVLLDCGMYQGRRREAFERNRNLPFVPQEISAVVLSRAHIDHSGVALDAIRLHHLAHISEREH